MLPPKYSTDDGKPRVVIASTDIDQKVELELQGYHLEIANAHWYVMRQDFPKEALLGPISAARACVAKLTTEIQSLQPKSGVRWGINPHFSREELAEIGPAQARLSDLARRRDELRRRLAKVGPLGELAT